MKNKISRNSDFISRNY